MIVFSDITALHNVLQKEGFASLHVLMARYLTVESEDDFCTLTLKDILFGHFNSETVESVETSENGFNYICPGHINQIIKEPPTGFCEVATCPYFGIAWYSLRCSCRRNHSFHRRCRQMSVWGRTYDLQPEIVQHIRKALRTHIIGQFTEYEENKSLGKDLYGAIADLVKEYDYPVCFNFPVGHVNMQNGLYLDFGNLCFFLLFKIVRPFYWRPVTAFLFPFFRITSYQKSLSFGLLYQCMATNVSDEAQATIKLRYSYQQKAENRQ